MSTLKRRGKRVRTLIIVIVVIVLFAAAMHVLSGLNLSSLHGG